jgi:DUF4097 and DUF4098 domain-containing protein YvlB
MKEETKRIMKLVQEGKLSPDDAAELIEAFNDAPDEPHENGAAADPAASAQSGASGEGKTEDPFSKLIGSIEKIGKDVAKNVNWNDIAVQVRQGVGKGVEAIKHATDEAKKGGGFAVIFGSSQAKRVELPLTVPEGKTLRIETRSGDVAIVGGAETGSLVIDAVFRSYDQAEAKKMADAYTPVLEEGDQYVVFRQPEGTNVSTNVTVAVPAGVPVEVKLTSGDVAVSETKAPVKIDGTSGDVSVIRATGAIQIAQRSGDVKVKDTDATLLTVETKSGNIELEEVNGVIEVKTSSGDVKLKDSKPKSLSIEAASGDVDVDLAAPVEGTVNLTAVSGDVSVLVMDGSDCRVSLSTLRGSVHTKLELTDETLDEQKVSGRLGAGTGSLEVSVVTGSVSLGLRDSAQS